MSKKEEVLTKYENELTDQVLYSEEEDRQEVLKRPINWESYGDAFVSKSDIQKILEYERPGTDKLEKFVQNGHVYAKIFLVFLAKIQKKDEDIKYVLTMVDDLLIAAQNSKHPGTDLQTVLTHFHKLQKTKTNDHSLPPMPFGPILTLLDRKKEDAYIISKASRILTTFILNFPDVLRETVENAFHWFVELLTNPPGKNTERKISIGLIGLRPLLAINDFRTLFVDDSIQGLPPLMHLATFEDRREDELVMETNITKKKKKGAKEDFTKETNERKGPNFQQIYEAVYCLWCLSFNSQAQQKMTDPKLIHNLCHIVKRCNKIKVIRISLATLRNLLGLGKNNEFMITCGLMQALALLKQKRWGDEELETDIKEIEQALEKNVDDLTSWDRYKFELISSKLEWTPPHKSNKFWQENFLKFEEDDFFCLKILKNILQAKQDPKAMAIACWDIGEFVRVHPGGKRICQMLDLKVPVMEMLQTAEKQTGEHQEDYQRLAKEALTALQKMMITNWEYLQ